MGVAGTFTPTASGSPTPTFAESGALPPGVTFSSGSLHGTATVAGSFPITLTASNGVGTDAVQSFTAQRGSAVPVKLTGPVVGIAANPTGTGYWVADSHGDVAPFGGVGSYGSLAGTNLNAPIVDIVTTPTGFGLLARGLRRWRLRLR